MPCVSFSISACPNRFPPRFGRPRDKVQAQGGVCLRETQPVVVQQQVPDLREAIQRYLDAWRVHDRSDDVLQSAGPYGPAPQPHHFIAGGGGASPVQPDQLIVRETRAGVVDKCLHDAGLLQAAIQGLVRAQRAQAAQQILHQVA